MAGFITLDRKILDWEWYDDINVSRLFIHLLLIANHKPGLWKGKPVGRGQVITGVDKLNEGTGLSIQQTRTCLEKLKSTGEITIKATNKFSLVTICKYDVYQSISNKNNNQTNNESTNNQQSNNNQTNVPITTNNNNSNNTNNVLLEKKESGGQPPVTPDSVPGYKPLPDGRSYIDREVFFTTADFNGLPDDKNDAIRTTLLIVKEVNKTVEEVATLWEVFKTMNLTFQKPYRNKDDVYNHFSNWCKTQSFKAQRKTVGSSTTAKAEKIANMTDYEIKLRADREAAKNKQPG
jgi:hypothetical protein